MRFFFLFLLSGFSSSFKVFVHMAYSQSARPQEHLEYFLLNGVRSHPNRSIEIDFVLSISGFCSFEVCKNPDHFLSDPIANFKVKRRDNIGYDFGSHHDALSDNVNKYDYFIFLNSGITGPFVPLFFPASFHWVDAFVEKLKGEVKLVGSSIMCLPMEDAGGIGPKVEGFCFGTDTLGLKIILDNSPSFMKHRTKEDAILNGEYAMTKAIFRSGFSIDSMLLSYNGRKWKERDECNHFLPPSRFGLYFGFSINPIEVIFHKTYWLGTGLGKSLPVSEKFVNERLALQIRSSKNSGIISGSRILVYVFYDEQSSRPSSHLEFFFRTATQTPRNSRVRVEYVITIRGECNFEVCRTPETFAEPRSLISKRKIDLRRLTFHEDAIKYALSRKHDFDSFIFISHEMSGPFLPSYTPKNWHWVEGFLDATNNGERVKIGNFSVFAFSSINLRENVLQDHFRPFCMTTNFFDCMFSCAYRKLKSFKTVFEDVEKTRYFQWISEKSPLRFQYDRTLPFFLCVLVVPEKNEVSSLTRLIENLKRFEKSTFMGKLQINICSSYILPHRLLDFSFVQKFHVPAETEISAVLDICVESCPDYASHFFRLKLSHFYDSNYLINLFSLDDSSENFWNLQSFRNRNLKFHNFDLLQNASHEDDQFEKIQKDL